MGREGTPIEPIAFASGDNGVPGFIDPPRAFAFEAGKTKINPGFDAAAATMMPGERRAIIVPAALAYGRAGHYEPEVKGQPRFVISPNAMLAYEVEALPNR